MAHFGNFESEIMNSPSLPAVSEDIIRPLSSEQRIISQNYFKFPYACMQALCSQVFKDNPPRRMVNVGLDFRRFDQALAVLIKHAKLKLYDQDVRANVLGGLPATEPAVDAAVAASIVSSFFEVPLPADVAFVGELDLGGAHMLFFSV